MLFFILKMCLTEKKQNRSKLKHFNKIQEVTNYQVYLEMLKFQEFL